MGSRGAASGTGKHPYGSEYKTVLQDGNIKFVKYRLADNAKAPLETQTKGRVYVTVNSEDKPAYISYYDTQGKRTKTIDLLRPHDNKLPHIHDGYSHGGNARGLTYKEKKLVEKVRQTWYNKRGKSVV